MLKNNNNSNLCANNNNKNPEVNNQVGVQPSSSILAPGLWTLGFATYVWLI